MSCFQASRIENRITIYVKEYCIILLMRYELRQLYKDKKNTRAAAKDGVQKLLKYVPYAKRF